MKSLASALFSVLLSAPTMAYELSGEWIEGGLLFGQADPGSQVQFKGEPVMVSDQGVFVIGLHRDEDDPVTLSVTEPDGTVDRQTFDVIQRDYLIQRVEGIARTIMEPSEADQNKIWADVLETREARAVRGDNLDFLADFTWPVRGPISGVYGSQRFYNGTPGNPHYGLDIAVPTGTRLLRQRQVL